MAEPVDTDRILAALRAIKIHIEPSGPSGGISIMFGNGGRVLSRADVRLLVAGLLACADPGVGDRMADVERDLREEIERPQSARKRRLLTILRDVEAVRRG